MRGEDVSFRDVKIKNPRLELRPGDVGDVTHWKHGLRFEKKQLVELLHITFNLKVIKSFVP